MSLPEVISFSYQGKTFTVDPFSVGFKSKVIKNLILTNSPSNFIISGSWTLEAFSNFISFCESNKTDFLTVENSPIYRSLGVAFDSPDFISATQSFFEKLSPNEIVRELLLQSANGIDVSTYEFECARKLGSIINDPALFNIPLSSLFKIFEQYSAIAENPPLDNEIGLFVLSLIQKKGSIAITFTQFVSFPSLSIEILNSYKDLFKSLNSGPLHSVIRSIDLQMKNSELESSLLKTQSERDDLKQKLESTNTKLEKLDTEFQIDKKSSHERVMLLNLYQSAIPIIPDIPFSLIFSYNGVELAFTMINTTHYDLLGRQIAAQPYQPNSKRQQWIFRTKKNTIENVEDPEKLFDDNCDRSNFLSGTILYCHPRNGFTNQQWDWINNGLRSWRSHKFVSYLPEMQDNPFRLYEPGEKEIQQFRIRYTSISLTSDSSKP